MTAVVDTPPLEREADGSTAPAPSFGGSPSRSKRDEIHPGESVFPILLSILGDAAIAEVTQNRVHVQFAELAYHFQSGISAEDMLALLTRDDWIGLLSPEIPSEGAILVELALGSDRTVREYALDVLTGSVDDATVLKKLIARLRLDTAEIESESLPKRPSGASVKEAAFLQCLRADDTDGAISKLADHAGFPADMVTEATWARDAKSLLAMAWRAGYSATTARLLQTALAGEFHANRISDLSIYAAQVGRGELSWHLRAMSST